MKKKIHPEYYPKATVTCSCGAKFYVGSSEPTMEVEICSQCHPFYTAQKRVVDTTGRVERFKQRTKKTEHLKSKKITNKKEKEQIRKKKKEEKKKK